MASCLMCAAGRTGTRHPHAARWLQRAHFRGKALPSALPAVRRGSESSQRVPTDPCPCLYLATRHVLGKEARACRGVTQPGTTSAGGEALRAAPGV